jgi:hypothetical protein
VKVTVLYYDMGTAGSSVYWPGEHNDCLYSWLHSKCKSCFKSSMNTEIPYSFVCCFSAENFLSLLCSSWCLNNQPSY